MLESQVVNDSAADSVAAGDPTGIPSALGMLDALSAVLLQGSSIGRACTGLGSELARIAIGRSSVEPSRGDWRFKDPTWSENPLYRRWAQAYLASCHAVEEVIEGMEGDWRRTERARFLFGILTSAAAPTNTLIGNPAALKRVLETGGANLISGVGNFAHDLTRNGGMPSTAKPGALTVGEHLAVTPGAVIDRDEVGEVLQYTPTTPEVRSRPVLVVPPPIGRYYFLDLQPGRSFVEYSVSTGLQTFMMSWRNPGAEEAEWNLDTYAARILKAIDTVCEITGSEDVNVIGFCAGGMLNATILSYLADQGDNRVHSAAYAVTLLDFGSTAPIGAFSSARLLSFARWNSKRSGVITAKAMGNVFSWMRPNDLVWNYWVNNYLMGQDPPVFDILSWNADGTNLPAALHAQFLDIFETNPLVRHGALEVLGVPVDLSYVKQPTYVVGAVNDHLTPWKGCFRTTTLMAGDCTFVLSNAGHIASLVNPVGNPKSSYFTGPISDGGPDEWLEASEKVPGSWWEHWGEWTLARSGETVTAPTTLGSGQHPALCAAPGTYVKDVNEE